MEVNSLEFECEIDYFLFKVVFEFYMFTRYMNTQFIIKKFKEMVYKISKKK